MLDLKPNADELIAWNWADALRSALDDHRFTVSGAWVDDNGIMRSAAELMQQKVNKAIQQSRSGCDMELSLLEDGLLGLIKEKFHKTGFYWNNLVIGFGDFYDPSDRLQSELEEFVRKNLGNYPFQMNDQMILSQPFFRRFFLKLHNFFYTKRRIAYAESVYGRNSIRTASVIASPRHAPHEAATRL
jgi:hypothetical protein